jgi:hypothetical protein
MDECQVDSESTASNLSSRVKSLSSQFCRNFSLEWRVEVVPRKFGCLGPKDFDTTFRIFEIVLQQPDTDRLRPVQVDIVALHRGNHLYVMLGSCDRYVKSPLSALPIQRSESHCEVVVGITPVPHTEEDGIPFVTLHVLKVFDEKRIVPLFVKEAIKLGSLSP